MGSLNPQVLTFSIAQIPARDNWDSLESAQPGSFWGITGQGLGGVRVGVTALLARECPAGRAFAREGKVRITAFLLAGELPSLPRARVGRLSVVSIRTLVWAHLSEGACSSFSFTLSGQRGAPAPGLPGSPAEPRAPAAVDEFRCHQGFSPDLGTSRSNMRTRSCSF